MRPGDLLGRAFPPGDWREPAERLDELYQWAEQGALEVVHGYLAARVRKRRGARALRGCAVSAASLGALVPLLELADVLPGPSLHWLVWGYVAFLAAAACAVADRCLGMTSGWMRDVAAAQAVQRRLETFQYDWATENVRGALGGLGAHGAHSPVDDSAGEAAERCLGLLRRFTEDVAEIVRTETTDWMVEFRTVSAPLHLQSAGAPRPRRTAHRGPNGYGHGSGHGGHGGFSGYGTNGSGPGRFPPPPGTRPNMPRQRPPEG